MATTLILLVSVWDVLPHDSGERNLYAHQAQAWLKGRLYLDRWLYDSSVFDGKSYVSFPPFPSVILLPFVRLFGVPGTKVVLIAVAMSAISTFVLVRLLQQLGVDQTLTLWVTAAMFFGTAYWFAVRMSFGVWFFAHVVSVTCLFVAIYAALIKGSGLMAGLFLGLSFLSRQLTICAGIFLITALWFHPRFTTNQARVIHLVAFAASLAICVGVYLLYNWMRFGNPLDTGYTYLRLQGFLKERADRYGLFNIAYVPFNLYYMFLQGFHLEFQPPALLRPIRVDPFGTAIAFASPFLYAAFLARWKQPLIGSAWLAIGLILIQQLFYYNNGSLQWNAQRFTLDFWPILIVLIALGAQHANPKLWRATVLFAIGLNVIALSLSTPG